MLLYNTDGCDPLIRNAYSTTHLHFAWGSKSYLCIDLSRVLLMANSYFLVIAMFHPSLIVFLDSFSFRRRRPQRLFAFSSI